MMNSTAQSTLARLLAKENITVQHGNYTTAFFDVEKRLLGLPMWKDKSKDVYDLLVGHEVGHALFTPRDFHHNSAGARQDYVNLVEDVRIERKVQSQYPGLISCFTRGYSTLKNENFFEVNGKDLSTIGFANRLNLKFKLRNQIEITFTAAEQQLFDLIERAETWDEVVAAAIALDKFIKEQRDQAKQPKQQPKQKPTPSDQKNAKQDPTPKGQDDMSDSNDSSEANAQDDSDEQKAKTDSASDLKSDDASKEKGSSDDGEQTDGDADQKSDEKPSVPKGSASDVEIDPTQNAEPTKDEDLDGVSTQRSFDTNTRTQLIDSSKETLNTYFASAPTTAECLENVLTYDKLNAIRNRTPNFTDAATNPLLKQQFQQFLKSTQKVVGMLVKEFDLRKAAYQYSRASVSKTGSLNLNKLHSYKISDDLFLSVTQLANAKNHGMLMFVDYSGSMQRQLPHVLKHLINMALFCRRTGIPFAVYGFTCDNTYSGLVKSVSYHTSNTNFTSDKVLVSNTILLELVTSDLNKTDFNDAIYALWLRAQNSCAYGFCEQLGDTPLNETLIIAHDLVKKFRARHNPDKMTTIFLTDGAGHSLRVTEAASLNDYRVSNKRDYYASIRTSFKLNGRTVNSTHRDMTASLIENLKISANTEVIGFYVPACKSLMRQHAQLAAASMLKDITKGFQLWTTKLERIYKEEEVLSLPGAFNYSSYFIVALGDDLAVNDDDELEVTADMSRGKIARAFMDYSSSKKANRVFVTKFAEAIA